MHKAVKKGIGLAVEEEPPRSTVSTTTEEGEFVELYPSITHSLNTESDNEFLQPHQQSSSNVRLSRVPALLYNRR